MVTFNQKFSIVISIVIFSTSNSLTVVESKNVGFHMDLIHRDSLKSPFSNHSINHSQHFENALRRSVQWFDYFKYGSADIIPDHGEYLLKLSFGTPPVEILVLADTGSDLIWIQCELCVCCFEQKDPIFNPKKSSTYKEIPCNSGLCRSTSNTYCADTTSTCQYSTFYEDKSFSHGNLAIETLTLVSTEVHLRFPNTIFGCGHNNNMGSFGDKANGVVGLGTGRESFISQASRSIGGKFSYCLVSYESTKSGKLYIGDSDEFPSTDGAIFTRLIPSYQKTYHYVSLDGITIENEWIVVPFPQSMPRTPLKGNMMIDSGTTLTMLPLDVYNRFESAVKRNVKLWPVKDPTGILKLCYNTLQEYYFPLITLNFKEGDLELNKSNTFVKHGGLMCLAFSPGVKTAILGNLAQMNLFVSFDLERNVVSFKHTDCEKV